MHTRQTRVWKLKCKNAEKDIKARNKTIRKLRKTIAMLTKQAQTLEDRVEELEEEAVELRKEKELLEDDDAPDLYHMDLEDDDPSDHDEAMGEESEDEPIIPYRSEEEEDLEERVFGSWTRSDVVEVPEVP